MLTLTIGLLCLFSLVTFSANGAEGLSVYSEVPGLAPSEHFKAQVKPATEREGWSSAFMWQTSSKKDKDDIEKYPKHLAGWTHSYINFEMDGPVEIELSRVDQQPIRSASPHPIKKVKSCTIRDGKVYIVLDKPCLVAIDIDGQMNSQNTGMGYKGPAIHAFSIFANPPVNDKPKLDDPTVFYAKPGEIPPAEGTWKTLYFLPGVHDLGAAFPVHANRRYFIPGNALVYGSFSNHKKWVFYLS